MNRIKETVIDANSVRIKTNDGRVVDVLVLHNGNLRLDYSFSPEDWQKGQPVLNASRTAANQIEVSVNDIN